MNKPQAFKLRQPGAVKMYRNTLFPNHLYMKTYNDCVFSPYLYFLSDNKTCLTLSHLYMNKLFAIFRWYEDLFTYNLGYKLKKERKIEFY